MMFTLGENKVAEVDRRSVLRIGSLGMGGLTLSNLLRLEALGATESAAKRQPTSVIVIYMSGGPSHIDTLDMKPNAPVEFRGEFKPIATSVPDLQICEWLPMSAAIMHKWSIIRSLQHPPEYGDVGHPRGNHILLTGHAPGPEENTNIRPSVGSVAARELQAKDRSMPAYVMIPKRIPGTDSAYLGPAWNPFETRADPGKDPKFVVPNLSIPGGLGVERIGDRQRLLAGFDRVRREMDVNHSFEAVDEFQKQAMDFVTSPRVREAFDYDSEPAAVKERYGYPEPWNPRMGQAGARFHNWNQRFLLARRLVEAGVRLVTLDCAWWDTHADGFWSLKNGLLPPFDQAFSALIEDLDQRGLLDTTMVLAWGEYGRTPRVAFNGGRDHWTTAYSAAIAGGGVQGGRAIGATDSHAAVPKDNPKLPQDVLATVYRHLG
ncbi:MAG: DUF1501 domain-containing protein, partial [Planctomycetota bacterium]